MKEFFILFLLVLSHHGSICQDTSPQKAGDFTGFKSKFSPFFSSLKNHQFSETKTLKRLFHKAHRKILKNYLAYSTVEDVFNNGNYDCLSGTYFFSLALDELKIKYRVIETNYHIFIVAQSDRGEVLLESTDRFGGFVRTQKIIHKKLSSYRERNSGSPQLYLTGISLFHELLPNQLPGLLYFNKAVDAFHKNDLTACCLYLESAWKIYDNQRIEEFTPILVRSILHSNLDEKQKINLTGILKAHQQQTIHPLASR